MAIAFDRWEVPESDYAIITTAADANGVPRVLMLALAGLESTFGQNPRGDRFYYSGADADGYCSFGYFQFNRCGGAGARYSIADLLNNEFNAQAAGRLIRERYEATGSWYEAIQPWSTRDAAWTIYQQNGSGTEPVPQSTEGRPSASVSSPAAVVAPPDRSALFFGGLLAVAGMVLLVNALNGSSGGKR